jgi:hypothetical protein
LRQHSFFGQSQSLQVLREAVDALWFACQQLVEEGVRLEAPILDVLIQSAAPAKLHKHSPEARQAVLGRLSSANGGGDFPSERRNKLTALPDVQGGF